MIKSILLKEFLKLKIFIIALLAILLGILIYFYNDLSFLFKTTEPESMLWYRFAFLDFKPYEIIKWVLMSFAVILSFAQFVPERFHNKTRIIAHLPLKLSISYSLHIFVGLLLLFAIFIIIFCLLYGILNVFYPSPILNIFIQDLLGYFLLASILFLGISAAILDKNPSMNIIKILLIALFAALYLFLTKINFALWFLVLVSFFLLGFDSFLSVKERRLNKIILTIIYAFMAITASFYLKEIYINKIKQDFAKYYLFYSPIKKEFVYQKNFGKHQFEYGIINSNKFDEKTYKSYLPFVYWADFNIQGKLPINIDNKNFDKATIKRARLSMSYDFRKLQARNLKLYPLINSKSKKGAISFPENMFFVSKNKFNIYNFDEKLNKNLSENLNLLAKNSGLKFPIKNAWGKFTNMKNYDLGSFLQDKNDEIFNLKMADDKIYLRKIKAPKNIVYMKISENKQKKIAGFAIDKNSKFYILDWENFNFTKLDLPNFDYKTMKLQFLSNPLYYQIRYNDEDNYYISVFDKNFDFIKASKIEAK